MKKIFNKQQKVYYPHAIMQGKPVETGTFAKDMAKIYTVSSSDVQAVLGDISCLMHTHMVQGKNVLIKGQGYFHYVFDTVAVKSPNDFDFQKQVKAVRIEFMPERTKLSNGTYARAFVDSDEQEWIELSPETKDTMPGGESGGDGDLEENPLGQDEIKAVAP